MGIHTRKWKWKMTIESKYRKVRDRIGGLVAEGDLIDILGKYSDELGRPLLVLRQSIDSTGVLKNIAEMVRTVLQRISVPAEILEKKIRRVRRRDIEN